MPSNSPKMLTLGGVGVSPVRPPTSSNEAAGVISGAGESTGLVVGPSVLLVGYPLLSEHPADATIPVTKAVPVSSHVSARLRILLVMVRLNRNWRCPG